MVLLVRSALRAVHRLRPTLAGTLFTRGYSLDDEEDELLNDIGDDRREYEDLARQVLSSSGGERCFVVHPYVKWGPRKVRDTLPDLRLAEAVALVHSLDKWSVVGEVSAPVVSSLERTAVFGKGSLASLRQCVAEAAGATAVFVNVGSLRMDQRTLLAEAFGVRVFDRYRIVLEILRQHAASKHVRLQIALAEIPFLRRHLDGHGHDQLLARRELTLRELLVRLRSHRQLLRKRRRKLEIPVVAVVGYTNAGKTSLIKSLTGERSLVPKAQLFATLDVTVHAGQLPCGLQALYADTVGFISDIPLDLIDCFTATLEDAMFADVILHVYDCSHPESVYQRKHVVNTLHRLITLTEAPGDLDKKLLTVGNKVDAVQGTPADCAKDDILVSSLTAQGTDFLAQQIERRVLAQTDRQIVTIRVPNGGDESRWLYKNTTVIEADTAPGDCEFQLIVVAITVAKLGQFQRTFLPNKA